MRIFCWNVNSLLPTVRNINLKYGSLAKFFAELDADIVCLQEVKLPYAKLTKEVVVVEGYQSYWSCSEGKTGYSGVTTWARHDCAARTADADALDCEGCANEGRAIVTDHGSFVLFNVYVPNAGDRPERARLPAKIAFLKTLKQKIDALIASGRQVIAVGDFNVAAEQRDVHSAISWADLYQQSELDALHALFETCTDTWRHLHPSDEGVYTVWSEKTSARAFNVGLRIDYALCSTSLLPHVTKCEILLDLPPKWSDHAPVLLELQLSAAVQTDTASCQQQSRQHQPESCPMWQQLLKQFADPSQKSIASMFRAASKSQSNSGSNSAVRKAPAAVPAGAGNSSDCRTEAEGPGESGPADSSSRKRPREQKGSDLQGQVPAQAETCSPEHQDGLATQSQPDDKGGAGKLQATLVVDEQECGRHQQGVKQGKDAINADKQASGHTALRKEKGKAGKDAKSSPRQAKLQSFFAASAKQG